MDNNKKPDPITVLKFLRAAQFIMPIIVLGVAYIISLPGVVFSGETPMRTYLPLVIIGVALLDFVIIRYFLVIPTEKQLSEKDANKGYKDNID